MNLVLLDLVDAIRQAAIVAKRNPNPEHQIELILALVDLIQDELTTGEVA